MAKKLKTYETSLGFFDLAIAAPSMKAALEAWGADSNLFHQGAAKQSEDPDVVAATMAKPGVMLKRPVGSNGPFKERAELPRDLAGDGRTKKAARKTRSRKPRKQRRRPPTKRRSARPHSHSRRSTRAASANAQKMRRLNENNANDGRRISMRRKAPWTWLAEAMIGTPPVFRPKLKISKSSPGWKRCDGERSGPNSRPRYDVLAGRAPVFKASERRLP